MPQRHQLPTTFQFTIEEVFETIEALDLDMTIEHSSIAIDTIVNIKFSNTFHHYNGPTQHQLIHEHTGQQYQSRSPQISRNLSHPCIKGKYFGCGLDNR